MNKKKWNFHKKIIKYLRDFSIVVAGIAVTLWAQNLLISHSEEKDIAFYLNALKMELQYNIDKIDAEIEYMEKSVAYARYLLSHDKEMLNPDTIQSYGKNIVYNLVFYMPRTSAFEMFKSSANMRLIKDKEVLQSIWNAYALVDRYSQINEIYYQEKKSEFNIDRDLERQGKPVTIPMYYFYTSGLDSNILQVDNEIAQAMKEILSRLEKYN
ncbi:MAG: hypothetical protein LBQ28_01250 [Prevotellaceae bacterium]|jgi:hypothetical protein|nr:hypothetical protein [Prevotellaceae bacterium]